MERDLSAARRIQGALLPRLPGPEYGLDIAARVVSSRELSGDLYDFLRYGPQESAIAIGDVSGKVIAKLSFGYVQEIHEAIPAYKPHPIKDLETGEMIDSYIRYHPIEDRIMVRPII